jgi:beta-glucosidase
LKIMWLGDIGPGVVPGQFSARLSGMFTASETGPYAFSLISTGLSRLFVNDQLVVDNWTNWQSGEDFFGFGSSEVRAPIDMIAGQTYRLRIDYSNHNAMLSALRVGCALPVPENLLERAAQLAAESDVAVVFAGLGGEWESEGYDRPTIDLPPAQNELIATVAAANPNTVVVLNTGSPVTMPWLPNVRAVLQAWYPGQECGNAIADVLFGAVNPSGKLPQTFPQRLEDNPAFVNYPGENGKVYYGEGIFVGYRYYEKKKIDPLFPFGHGLSYTTFDYSNLSIQADTSGTSPLIQVNVDITNAGTCAGQEVVQLYVRDIQAKVARPEKELKAFAKVQLQPGESQRVAFSLNRDALAYYDTATKGWVAEAGTFEILLGSSSADIRLCGLFELAATQPV